MELNYRFHLHSLSEFQRLQMQCSKSTQEVFTFAQLNLKKRNIEKIN